MAGNKSSESTMLLGFVVAVVWTFFWYDHLDDVRNAALSKIQPCRTVQEAPTSNGFIEGVKNAGKKLYESIAGTECERKINAEKDEINGALRTRMLFVVLSAFMIVPMVGKLSSSIIESAERNRQLQEHADRVHEQKRREQIQAEEVQKNLRATEEMRQSQRILQLRTTLINKIGIVNDYISHMDDVLVSGDDRALIRQSIVGDLREILANHLVNDIRQVVQAYDEIQVKIRHMDAGLQRHSIHSTEALVLIAALPPQDARTGT